MAAKSLGRYHPGSSSTPTTFTIPPQSDFQPNSMLPQYPTALAFWHNPHLLQQPVPDPSAAPAQSQMSSDPPEQKKHKRTRSGCFTCRSRRIKCDETHPVCERCSKGKRECVYPPAPEPRRGSRSNLKASAKHPPIAESESEDDGRHQDSQPDSKSGGAEQRQPRSGLSSRARNTLSRRRSAQSLAKKKARQGTESASTALETSGSPSTDLTSLTTDSLGSDASIDLSSLAPESPLDLISDLPGASNLKPDVQFFLAYRRKYVGSRHYFLSPHKEEFIHGDLVRYALEYEPLLYALVGFAAYHYSLGQPNGRLYTFLQYYNQSVSSLLKSLQAKDHHDDSMLLTVLQLTAFEEYLGDWVNLIDHHEAAHRMILELYTPELIREDDFRRNIVTWCCRFDVMAGLMGGNAAILSREWYTAVEASSGQDAANSPGDLGKYLFAWGARNRKFAMDMASTFAKAFNGLIDADSFAIENQELVNSLDELEQSLEAVKDPRHLVTCYPNEPRGPEDVIDVATSIYGGHLGDLNLCTVDLIGTALMYKYQLSIVSQNSDLSELRDLSLNQCRIMDAMLRTSDNPGDLLLSFRNTLGFIAVFLGQQDEVHQMWCRRKLAMLEQLGYVYPPAFRNRIADVWKAPDVAHWWLPNDEGYANIVREIRDWTNERIVNPRDTSREAVRDMKSIFGRMNLDDSTSASSSSPSTLSGGPNAGGSPD